MYDILLRPRMLDMWRLPGSIIQVNNDEIFLRRQLDHLWRAPAIVAGPVLDEC